MEKESKREWDDFSITPRSSTRLKRCPERGSIQCFIPIRSRRLYAPQILSASEAERTSLLHTLDTLFLAFYLRLALTMGPRGETQSEFTRRRRRKNLESFQQGRKEKPSLESISRGPSVYKPMMLLPIYDGWISQEHESLV